MCVLGAPLSPLSSVCAGDVAEVVFDLCGDISECLDRLHLGTLLGYLLTPDGWGCLGHIFFFGGGASPEGTGEWSPGKGQSEHSFWTYLCIEGGSRC